MTPLNGKVCVVNGAASEIGQAVAGRFASEGGVVQLSRDLGVQLARSGVRVNAVLFGPIGGYFVWGGGSVPLLLLAGGSGVVPLRAMLRHRSRAGSSVPVRLLYSVRSLPDVIYRSELGAEPDGVQVIYTLTRQQPPSWTGYARRVDPAMIAEVAWPEAQAPLAYVCGPTNFVEAVAADLVALGYPPQRVKTERFGATGTP